MSIFTQVQMKKPGSNIFDLSHDRKMSLKMGELVPIHVQEVIPGDNIRMSTSQLLRLAPMVAPVMHAVNVYTHFFFVPNRIMWPNWEKFITGGEDGEDTTVFPFVDVSMDEPPGNLMDYIGLPVASTSTELMRVSCLPFYAYNKIYNEYYRDQNLIQPLNDTAIDGDNTLAIISTMTNPCLKRAWQHDYFTSALPWTQKGPEATIPLGTTAPIGYEASGVGSFSRDPLTGSLLNAGVNSDVQSDQSTAILEIDDYAGGSTDQPLDVDNSKALFADLSQATAATIIDLRRAFRLQEWLEKNARGGSRYNESILSHFGVRSPDARLQRPEFLGGGTSPVTISEVLQTSGTDSEPTPQGNMAGHGISVGANNSFSYYAQEHGYIIGIMSILPKTAYQQGIPKHFLKFDKFDYYWPSFAHIGEQPIYGKEIYIDDPTYNESIFGYTPRYAEYKFINSSVHGEFRTTLDFWHMGRIFENPPLLNQSFVEADPTTRIFAVEDTETIYAHVFHRIKARRLMPYFGNPKM